MFMKKLYFLGVCLFLLTACSKDAVTIIDDNPDDGITLKACFEVSALSLNVGEMLQITNCSEGATASIFDFGNGEISEDDNPSISYEEGGTYTITLTVTNADQETKTITKSVTVMVVEALYLYPEIPEGYTGFPLETGINPDTGNIYSIEVYQDNIGPGGSKFYYREFNEDFVYASNYIADKPYNAGSAFVNFYPDGDMNFVFSRTLGGLFGSQEVTYNLVWTFLNTVNSASKHSYGYLSKGTEYLYFGAQEDTGIFKAAIETRNSGGDAYATVLNSFGDADSMIGDMIEVDDGYVAYGAVFTKNVSLPYVSDYKPLLVFLDADLNVTSHVIYEDSALTSKISSFNDINGSYHLVQLSNGNFVMYSNGELIVVDASGNKLTTAFFEGTSNNQALVSLEDSFVISTDEYLRKFNAGGSQMNQLKYNGNHLPELLIKDNTLFFIAGYDLESDIKIFYGACDFDLTLIDLRP
jgi:PKD repeat protein